MLGYRLLAIGHFDTTLVGLLPLLVGAPPFGSSLVGVALNSHLLFFEGALLLGVGLLYVTVRGSYHCRRGIL